MKLLKSKKGFEMSMSLIAIVIVVLVVLAIVIIFVSGAAGSLFGKMGMAQSTLTTDDIQTFQLGCKNACMQAKQMVSSLSQWKASRYCTATLFGKPLTSVTDYKCWDVDIGVDCSVPKVLVDDKEVTCKIAHMPTLSTDVTSTADCVCPI